MGMSKFQVEFTVGGNARSTVVNSRLPEFRGAGGPADVRIAKVWPRFYKKVMPSDRGIIKVVRVTRVV